MEAEYWLRIRVVADEGVSFIAMFEPSGMTYEMQASEEMFADVPIAITNEIKVIQWDGGISIWAPGSVITRDASGNELDRLN